MVNRNLIRHNLHFLLDLMRQMRLAILGGHFTAYKEAFLGRYRVADQVAREKNRRLWRNDNSAETPGSEGGHAESSGGASTLAPQSGR